MGGFRYVTGDPVTPPARVSVSIGDELAGTFAALGTLVALHHRQNTGRGQVVDASLYESVFAMMEALYQSAYYIGSSAGSTVGAVAFHAGGWSGTVTVGLLAVLGVVTITVFGTRAARVAARREPVAA
ncbi:Formyl-CoA:oxalate CoA-transferase [Streptomyces alboniger]